MHLASCIRESLMCGGPVASARVVTCSGACLYSLVPVTLSCISCCRAGRAKPNCPGGLHRCRGCGPWHRPARRLRCAFPLVHCRHGSLWAQWICLRLPRDNVAGDCRAAAVVCLGQQRWCRAMLHCGLTAVTTDATPPLCSPVLGRQH